MYNGLQIDFSFSIQDWLDVFEELFDAINDFFKKLFGTGLFADEEVTTAAAE